MMSSSSGSRGWDAGEPLRIFLWGVPRSCSTAFTKFMSFVEDMSEVWFEPYVVSYVMNDEMISKRLAATLTESSCRFPEDKRGNLRTMSSFSYASTKSDLESPREGSSTGKYIFIKDMSWAIHGHYEAMPDAEKVPVRHFFVIRHPHRFLSSHFAHMRRIFGMSPDAPIDTDMDIVTGPREDQSLKLWRYIKEKNIDPNPVVIDSDQLLQDPGRILPKLFAELGIPWKDSYLTWSEKDDFLLTWTAAAHHIGSELSNGAFGRAFTSKEFIKTETPLLTREELSPEVEKTVDIFMPGYEEMLQHALH